MKSPNLSPKLGTGNVGHSLAIVGGKEVRWRERERDVPEKSLREGIR